MWHYTKVQLVGGFGTRILHTITRGLVSIDISLLGRIKLRILLTLYKIFKRFRKRIKDELSGIKTSIKIDSEMKDALEKNYSKNFSASFPFRLHYLAFRENGKLRIIPVKRGRAALLSCVYSKFEEIQRFCKVKKNWKRKLYIAGSR